MGSQCVDLIQVFGFGFVEGYSGEFLFSRPRGSSIGKIHCYFEANSQVVIAWFTPLHVASPVVLVFINIVVFCGFILLKKSTCLIGRLNYDLCCYIVEGLMLQVR